LKRIFYFLFLMLLLNACQPIEVFERTTFFENHSWSSKVKPSFTFQITDTTSLYKVMLVLRHKDAYSYNNIWVKLETKGPSDSVSVRREFTLATSSKGWLGSGMDDIFEHRIPFNEKPAPLKAGTYTFTLTQDMREDPLDNILNVGIRVQKVN
jgi:gliding motility-associated lipoprotein GldH